MGIKYTCSTHNGVRFSQRHNCDKDFRNNEEHIDKDRDIIVLHNEPIKDFYSRFFKQSLEEYNEKQKRKDRKIEDYYTHILNNKKQHVAYEMIVQIGNIDVRPNEEICVEILREFYSTWQERNPNLECISASIHLDEKTPHMHIDYVPISYKNKRGLSTQNGLEKAFEEMGYLSDKFHETAQIKWQMAQNDYLIGVCASYGIEIENPKKVGQKHLEKEDFIVEKIKEKECELDNIECEVEEKKEEAANKIIYFDSVVKSKENEAKDKLIKCKQNYDNKVISLKENYDNRVKEVEGIVNEKIENMQTQYDTKIVEFRKAYNKEKERYNNMCFKVNEKKKEYNELLEFSEHSIVKDFITMGKNSFGKKTYTQEEMDSLIHNIRVVEAKLDDYNRNKQGIEQLEKNYSVQVQTKNEIIENLQENIRELQDENINLQMYKYFVDDTHKMIDFESYKQTKGIIEEEVFGFDKVENRHHKYKEKKIVDLATYKEEKDNNSVLDNENKKYMEF